MRRLNRLNNNKQDFDKNVFINCPFDDDYKKLFKLLGYIVLCLRNNPKFTSRHSDKLPLTVLPCYRQSTRSFVYSTSCKRSILLDEKWPSKMDVIYYNMVFL